MIVEFETKYTKKGFWCDDCSHEMWIKKKQKEAEQKLGIKELEDN